MTAAPRAELALDLSAERRLAGANLVIALVALFGGVTVGTITVLVLYHLMRANGQARGTDLEAAAITAAFEPQHEPDDAR